MIIAVASENRWQGRSRVAMADDGGVDHEPAPPLDGAVIADAARQLGEILAAVDRRELQAPRGQRDRIRGAVATLRALSVG